MWGERGEASTGRIEGCREVAQDTCCQFSEEEEVAYNTGLGQAVVELGEAIHALDPRLILLPHICF